MIDWEDLRHFSALATEGSLSAAARRLDVEHATVARRVAALERSLDLKLVDRRGRRLALTADGMRIAAIAQRMDGEAQAVRRAVDSARSELAGTVTISAPPALAAAVLAEPLVALRRRHPGLDIFIRGEARRVSLDRREADIALRLERPERGDLTIVQLGALAFRAYACPSYLVATEPAQRHWIVFDATMGAIPQQRVIETAVGSRPVAFACTTLEIQRSLARAGGGVAMLPDFMAAGDAGLVEADGEAAPVMRGLWLVTHSDMTRAAPVRVVADALKDWFARRP